MSSTRLLLLSVVVALGPATAAPGGDTRFNALLASPSRQPLRLSAPQLQGLGLRVAHEEPRLGLPTVTWATRPWPAAGTGAAAARAHLAGLAPLYGLRAADVERARLLPLSPAPVGARVAQFRQQVHGAEVFRAQLALVMDRNDGLVAATGYLAPGDLVSRAESLPRSVFQLSPEQAVARALADAVGLQLPATAFRAAPEDAGGYRAVQLAGNAEGWDVRGARARRTWFLLPGALEPAVYVELEPARGGTDGTLRAYVLSARTGALLFRHVLSASDSFSYRTWADPNTFVPYPGPQGLGASPHPTGTPTVLSPVPVAPELVTLQSAPYSQGDPWLAPGATVTTGNNAEAYADLDGTDGFQAGGADLRATTTAPGVFDRSMDVTTLTPGANADQRMAAVTSLFYTGNFLHDWFYDSGFNEVSGNGQASNSFAGVDRGGLAGDALRLEAQDAGGMNNANMQTPADGASPRMQMFLWSGNATGEYLGPASPASQFSVGAADFGAQLGQLTGTLALAADSAGATTGCVPYAPGTFTGLIALVDRGSCSFVTKAANAQAAGAVGVVIANSAAGGGIITMTGNDPTVVVPCFSVSTATGAGLKAQLQGGEPVQVRLTRLPERDGTVDNDIVAHEWAHYLSNRLVGNANGLDNVQGGALGEGWSDFVALLLKVRNADRLLLGNERFQGAYPIASWSLSNQDPLAWYYGLRRVPYSTAFSRDPLTFRHVQMGEPAPAGAPLTGWYAPYNPEVHYAGEVWASMLWDCYVALLERHPFAEAQARMKGYLVASLKLTPSSPTYLEARDALWAVAAAADAVDLQAFVEAFARRGAGYGAVGPDRGSVDLVAVRESYEAGSVLVAADAQVVESGSGCDADGWLDVGEDGVVSLVLRNAGAAPLAPFTATAAASQATAQLAFPSGVRVSVPALAPGASFTALWPVSLLSASAPARTGLSITFDEPSLPVGQRAASVELPVDVDVAAESSAVDGFELPGLAWDCAGNAPADCTVLQDASGRVAHVGAAPEPGERMLVTPALAVGGGELTVDWKARWSFEISYNGGRYDGAVVEVAEEGQPWVDVTTLGVSGESIGYVSTVSTSATNPLSGRPALTFINPAWPLPQPYALNLGTQFAGKTVRLRFRVGTDEALGAWGLELDDVQVGGLLNTPFPSLLDELGGDACNQRPVARPGGPQSAPESLTDGSGRARLNVIGLDGMASSDPEGGQLSWAWTQVGGPPVTLFSADTARPSFTVDVTGDQDVTFQLVVRDGQLASVPATVQVRVLDGSNRAPVAVATAPASVDERAVGTVTLDGSGSMDADNDALAYAWTQVSGPPVALSGAMSAQASFAVEEVAADTAYGFQLAVDDGLSVATASLGVTVHNVDRAPTVSAGADRTVPGRAVAVLGATASDPDGELLALQWTQLDGPAVVLSGADGPAPSFTAPDVKVDTALRFSVRATAGGLSAMDEVVLTVAADRPPTVSAGADRAVAGRAQVTVAAVAADPDGDGVSFQWTQVSGPPVVLSGAQSPAVAFTTPDVKAPADVTLSVTVTANGLAATDEVVLSVAADRPPQLSTAATRTVASRGTLSLLAQASDPDGDGISFQWTQLSGPPVALSGVDSAGPSFTAPSVAVPTAVRLQVVAGANGLSAQAEVEVTVQAEGTPVADAGPDVTVPGRMPVVLRGTGSVPDGSPVAFAWTQLAGPAVALAGAGTATPTFLAPDVKQPAVLRFQLQVSAHGLAADDTVEVAVLADGAPVVSAGEDQDVASGARVTLTAAGSDPEQDPLSYAWSVVSGPEVTLSGAQSAVVHFDVPSDLGGEPQAEWVLQAVVSANGLSSAPAQVRVRARQVNRVPVVTGPNALSVEERTLVQLDASAVDPDGEALTWAWQQVGGPTVALAGQQASSVQFLAPEVESELLLAFSVVASDAAGAVGRAEVTVGVRNVNRAPVAAVTGPTEVDAGAAFVLSGVASTDPDRDALAWAWTRVAGPEVALADATLPVQALTAPVLPEASELVLELTVTDTAGAKATAQHAVRVRAAPPAAKPGSGCGCASAGAEFSLGWLAWLSALGWARRRSGPTWG
jgi:hypothetical protein